MLKHRESRWARAKKLQLDWIEFIAAPLNSDATQPLFPHSIFILSVQHTFVSICLLFFIINLLNNNLGAGSIYI